MTRNGSLLTPIRSLLTLIRSLLTLIMSFLTLIRSLLTEFQAFLVAAGVQHRAEHVFYTALWRRGRGEAVWATPRALLEVSFDTH